MLQCTDRTHVYTISAVDADLICILHGDRITVLADTDNSHRTDLRTVTALDTYFDISRNKIHDYKSFQTA